MKHTPTEGRDLRGDNGRVALARTIRSAPERYPVTHPTGERRRDDGDGPVSIQPSHQSLHVVPRQLGAGPMPADARMARDFDELQDWARAMEATMTVVDEDWQSVTYEAAVLVDGERICCRFRDRLPKGTALRRLARTYVVGMCHEVDDGECCHVRQVMPPCLNSPETLARERAKTLAGALVETERRAVCGATATTLHIYLVERAIDWRP